jgi:hypothetical protein
MSYLKNSISSIYWANMSGKDLKVPFYNVRFFGVYLLPFFEIKSRQAEFLICYVTFYSLQNGKKIFEKKAYNGCEKSFTLWISRWTASRKTTSSSFHCPSFMKIFISEKLELHPRLNSIDSSLEKTKKIFRPLHPWGGPREFRKKFFFLKSKNSHPYR